MKKHLRHIAALIALILALGIAAVSLSGCKEDENVLHDGYFTAVQSGYEHGWQEYLTIDVKNGKIVTAEFQAITPSGFVKSWDLNYMRTMNATDGTYPNEYVRILTQEFLEKQDSEVDAVTGATNSSTRFLKLAALVIEQAKAGDANVAVLEEEGGEEAHG
ncbi:MAG: FMN-binding protein [Clostridiales Family XIII bacterium]|jgi:major membrane immunogen (membrane-anchored lipoprotein)|nr:FMN-binding protein [Clostridiales Family XIII bacterium]